MSQDIQGVFGPGAVSTAAPGYRISERERLAGLAGRAKAVRCHDPPCPAFRGSIRARL